jgi:hypothetical protein
LCTSTAENQISSPGVGRLDGEISSELGMTTNNTKKNMKESTVGRSPKKNRIQYDRDVSIETAFFANKKSQIAKITKLKKTEAS